MDFYRSSTGGYTPAWGPPTSTLNFCEEDYAFTPYVAEVFNTVTNLGYIVLGANGIVNNRRRGAKDLQPQLPFIALVFLGFASSLFHASLKYATQMVDEFTMLVATFIVFYRLFSFSSKYSPRTITIALSLQMSIVVVSQILTGDSIMQQVTFTCMTYYLWYKTFALIGSSVKDVFLKRKMRIMAVSGIAFFIAGHFCWIIDFYACTQLRAARKSIGMPWASLLELHGLWHILTGVGVYLYIVLVECLRFASYPDVIAISSAWPSFVFLRKDPQQMAKDIQDNGKKAI